MYEILANAIVLIHAALMALVIGGALVATTPRVIPRFPRWLVVAYLISVGLTLLSYLFFGDCLMTVWEKALRDQAAPGSAYGETFLQHYFGFLPHSFTQPGHFASGLGAILAVTVWAIRQWTRASKSNRLSDLSSTTAQQSPMAGVLKEEPEERGVADEAIFVYPIREMLPVGTYSPERVTLAVASEEEVARRDDPSA